MFSKEEKIWIITNYQKEKGFQQLRRDFIQRYRPANKKTVPQSTAFYRVVDKFSKKGHVQDCKGDCGRKSLPEAKVSQIKEHFEANPRPSLRRASADLGISISSVQKTLKKTLKFKSYKPTLVQTLKPEHLLG